MSKFDVPQKSEAGNLMVKILTPEQIKEINEYLDSLGQYGEIHLIVQRGELRYINTVASHKAIMINQCREREYQMP